MSNAKFQKQITYGIVSSAQAIAKWQEQLGSDAAYAFQWANDAMQAAAKLDLYKKLDVYLKTEQFSMDETKKYLQDIVSRAAKYPPRSTSPMSNEMEILKAQAAAELLEQIEYYL